MKYCKAFAIFAALLLCCLLVGCARGGGETDGSSSEEPTSSAVSGTPSDTTGTGSDPENGELYEGNVPTEGNAGGTNVGYTGGSNGSGGANGGGQILVTPPANPYGTQSGTTGSGSTGSGTTGSSSEPAIDYEDDSNWGELIPVQ